MLDLLEPEIAPLDPPSPKTPPYGTKHKMDRITRCRDGHSRMFGAYGTPFLGEGEVVGGQRWHH